MGIALHSQFISHIFLKKKKITKIQANKNKLHLFLKYSQFSLISQKIKTNELNSSHNTLLQTYNSANKKQNTENEKHQKTGNKTKQNKQTKKKKKLK